MAVVLNPILVTNLLSVLQQNNFKRSGNNVVKRFTFDEEPKVRWRPFYTITEFVNMQFGPNVTMEFKNAVVQRLMMASEEEFPSVTLRRGFLFENGLFVPQGDLFLYLQETQQFPEDVLVCNEFDVPFEVEDQSYWYSISTPNFDMICQDPLSDPPVKRQKVVLQAG